LQSPSISAWVKSDGVQANIACPPEAKSDCECALFNFGIGLIMVDAEF
jgi:hypothetical protein